ncbi:hypothetical protein ACCO45_000016 [Purpureocillium lilacinum]|uniref:Uncharacterized protein n=1 Tax=Purpureocillium lilacinum TaxID=33203 RepID=A0ACC4ECK3_PURLI
MPGKHVPPGPLSKANDFLGAVPPTNGWLVELGYLSNEADQAAERNCVLKLVQLSNVDVTIPIHYDDCSVFVSPFSDFKEEMAKTQHKAVCLDRGEPYAFNVRD